VLSPSTEEYDRGAKLEHYQTMASLKEILLVAHDRRAIEIVRREPDGAWARHVVVDDGVARSAALVAELPLSEVYRDPLPST
jgi:Uma2 family endonuclease